ncbi:MAG: CvpA family protein [Christensenellales bacterium]|nr:CvpA family protein [Christensenellales bacterium]
MNIVDFIILAILGFGLLSGMYKGFITSGLATFGFAAAWFSAQSIYERVAHFALSNSTLMAVLNQYLEPEAFFENHTQAVTAVSEVIAGGEAAISSAVNSVSGVFSFISEPFSANLRNQAFAKLGITTMSDYFNQTLWVAVFNVLAFIVSFLLIYMVIMLVVNLLDRVISFPVLRGFDWLVGGAFGLLRSSVVVVLVLSILPVLTSIISPDLTQSLMSESQLVSYVSRFDLLNVAQWFETLIFG